jgi:NTE family protein
MGNSASSLQDQDKLLTHIQLLERQIHTAPDKHMVHLIQNVKQQKLYTNLVLAGGSTKCFAEAGALRFLEENGYLKNIINVAGSSGGAFMAAMWAIGYTGPELCQMVEELDWKSIGGLNRTLVSDIFHVAHELGINNGQHLLDAITHLIEKRTGNRNYTLMDIWNNRRLNLVITGTDLTTKQTVFFTKDKYPNIPLRILLRISCAAPPLYAPIIFDGHYFSDGGIRDNCPITIFDGDSPDDYRSQLNMLPPNEHTLAIRTVPTKTTDLETKHTSSMTLLQYLGCVVDSIYNLGVERFQTPTFSMRCVSILVPNYPTTKFDLTRKEITDLIETGANQTKKFMEQ